MTLVAGALSVVTILQAATGSYWSTWGGFGNAAMHQIEGTVDSWRPSGPLTDANFYAQILLLALPIGLDRLFHGRGRWVRIGGLLVSLLILAAILLTYSRGGLLGVLLIGALLLWRIRSRALIPALAVFVVVGAVSVTFLPNEYAAQSPPPPRGSGKAIPLPATSETFRSRDGWPKWPRRRTSLASIPLSGSVTISSRSAIRIRR